MTDRRHFLLDDAAWTEFNALLERDMLTDEQFDAAMAELYDLGDRMLSRITESTNVEALQDFHEHVSHHGLLSLEREAALNLFERTTDD